MRLESNIAKTVEEVNGKGYIGFGFAWMFR